MFLPAVFAEPDTPSLRSLSRSSVALRVYDFFARSACTSAVRPSLTRLRYGMPAKVTLTVSASALVLMATRFRLKSPESD